MFRPRHPAVETPRVARGNSRLIPERIRRSRKKGDRMPAGAVYVGRPTKYGNPFKGDKAVVRYRAHLENQLREHPHFLDSLRKAKFLACWCALDKPCHVDVIIEFMKEKEQ